MPGSAEQPTAEDCHVTTATARLNRPAWGLSVAAQSVNSVASRRGAVEEYLISNIKRQLRS